MQPLFKLLIGLTSLIFVQLSYAQVDFLDNLYVQTHFSGNKLITSGGKQISSDTLKKFLYYRDTVFLDIIEGSSENKRFQNLIYFDPSIMVFSYTRIIDTVTNSENSNFVDFQIQDFDDNGEYLGIRDLFSIRREIIWDLDSKVISPQIDHKLITSINETWRLHKLLIYKNKIELDSCLNQYQLQLKANQQFLLSFKGDPNHCLVNRQHDNFFGRNQVRHTISIPNGFWRTINNELVLVDVDREQMLQFEYQILENGNLMLRINEAQEIEFKKHQF